jgi:hypothetical protein
VDELTAERYPHPVPRRERYARPNPLPRGGEPVDMAVIMRRRRILCGTDDLTVLLQGGSLVELLRAKDRRVSKAIRKLTWDRKAAEWPVSAQ